ncbi:MAG: 2-oxo acid dehydrogenase subunit E2 [Eubacterium sp.]|nr:2-oxo acid dehydrogenase subunit E2 [Eubacterium sp.]
MKRWGDRFDGKLLRDVDAIHFLMPFIYPKRTDNEGYISETIDLTAATAFLEKKNAEKPTYKYTMFQLITAAMMKTLVLRPKLNRYIKCGSMYHRTQISAAFTVKKQFKDSSDEGLAFIDVVRADTLETIHDTMCKQIYEARKDGGDAIETIDIFRKLPRCIGRMIVRALCFCERHGLVLPSITKGDPGYATVFLTNLGSIGMKGGYHHLSNWGTNSIFVVIGTIKKRPFFDDNGKVTMKTSVDLGLTIDERIADGYYYSKSVKLLKYLLEHPEELEYRLDEKLHGRKKSSKKK